MGGSTAAGQSGTNGYRIPRVESIDCLRGLIMAFMGLDHARLYAFAGSFDLLDLKRTTLFLFFMRWMSNFGAPVRSQRPKATWIGLCSMFQILGWCRLSRHS